MPSKRIYRIARTGDNYRVALFEGGKLKAIVTSETSFKDAERKLPA